MYHKILTLFRSRIGASHVQRLESPPGYTRRPGYKSPGMFLQFEAF